MKRLQKFLNVKFHIDKHVVMYAIAKTRYLENNNSFTKEKVLKTIEIEFSSSGTDWVDWFNWDDNLLIEDDGSASCCEEKCAVICKKFFPNL